MQLNLTFALNDNQIDFIFLCTFYYDKIKMYLMYGTRVLLSFVILPIMLTEKVRECLWMNYISMIVI